MHGRTLTSRLAWGGSRGGCCTRSSEEETAPARLDPSPPRVCSTAAKSSTLQQRQHSAVGGTTSGRRRAQDTIPWRPTETGPKIGACHSALDGMDGRGSTAKAFWPHCDLPSKVSYGA
jgi:hypothetical protein